MTAAPAHDSGESVLIFARETLGAALLAALVETTGHTPLFSLASERADIAIARLRPRVVLVEARHGAARSGELFDVAARFGARVIVFSPVAPWEDLISRARAHPVATIVTPADGGSLAEALARALTSG